MISSQTKKNGMLAKMAKQTGESIIAILDKMTANKTSIATTNNSTANTSTADELLKFKQLLDMGALTQEEFDIKKKQLLSL